MQSCVPLSTLLTSSLEAPDYEKFMSSSPCCTYTYMRAVINILSSGNGRFAELNFPFAKLSLYLSQDTYIRIPWYQGSCLQLSLPGHGPWPMLEICSFVATVAELWRIFRETLRGISWKRIAWRHVLRKAFAKTCTNFPFANTIAELSESPQIYMQCKLYINLLPGPLDRCSCTYIYICIVYTHLVWQSFDPGSCQ